ncbi:conserved hypothetical protein [Leishmania mexicana MHOM/GT/2001/U1103]|uniref:Trafficking protein particle complex subunit 10 n=1 Tax=Leishmania mexicana (strain MHOM/GT/2001/U1103) TaxID=929439 RepID=E9AWU8_LEIMU|nr:conserved hypothetical protein [Leishmania mexicana MHOM/GT/2001/U1103]CBZ27434.1 conserved hypothetical protein [Leishmania mexicana MHOM/GT/2001/U1103]
MFPGYVPGAHSSQRPRSGAPSPLNPSNADVSIASRDEGSRSGSHPVARDTASTTPAAAVTNLVEADSPPTASPFRFICPDSRVDTHFDLPPALITCLVRHIDGQHQPLATPAIVERCLRDLQRRLMPWVPVERIFGSTMQATVPIDARTSGAAHRKDSIVSSPVSSPAPPPATALYTGSYLVGSRVHLQLAKTTDVAAVVSSTSVLHLLFYAVDESDSRPAVLSHIAQDWRAALTRKGEGNDCLVLLVHSDLIAAAEVAARLAEEAQQSSDQIPAAPSGSPPPPPPPTGSAAAPALIQARVDAAAGQLRKYHKELCDAKFLPQQICAYMPNETPMRILERLRSAVIKHGARLRQVLEACAAQKRLSPQDPFTKPGVSAAADAATTAEVQPPASVSSPNIAVSPTSAAGKVLHTDRSASPLKPPVGATSPSRLVVHKYWSVRAFWRCGYDLAVHYLQYGLVFDARAVLERLFLEYYNSSDDYGFLRAPVATLQRLGRVPNLFEVHRNAGWAQSKSGYPRGLDTEAELLEGLLLVASAEMSCSLLLGDTAAAMARYHTFMQVMREKFDEMSAANINDNPSVPPPPMPAEASTHGAAPLHSTTYQQLFLLQCYLSGLRMWWPMSGLCRPRSEVAASPSAATPSTPQLETLSGIAAEEQSSANEGGMVAVVADVDNDDDGGRASAEPPRPSSSTAPTTANTANVQDTAPGLRTDTDRLGSPACLDSGGSEVRYSITNPSFAAALTSVPGHSFRIGSAGPLSGRTGGEHSAMQWGPVEGDTSEDAEAMMCDRELSFLLTRYEDTVQVAATYLVDLATSTGLLPEHMELAKLQDSVQAIRDTVDAGDTQAVRALQHHQGHLRRSCAEAAALLENARDALAAVAHSLGYGNLSYPVIDTATMPLGTQGSEGPSGGDVTAMTTAASSALANIEELSSPEQALRLWRLLTAMAALAVRIAEQRRREFRLYVQLAVTFLMDHPNVTANIVAERLLPYIKLQGWRRIELFVRRLYVEARERLMRRAGLFDSCSTATTACSGDVAPGTAMSGSDARLWLRVFHTSADYALYRECVLVLLSNSGGGGDEDDGSSSAGDSADSVGGAADCGVAAECIVGSLDSRFFSVRTRAEQWRELVRVDALLMGTVLHGEPYEYPLVHFTSPLTVKVEQRADAAVSNGDGALVKGESSTLLAPGVLKAVVGDVVQITFSSVYTINPLVRPAFPAAAERRNAVARETKQAVWFQLTLESRKDWNSDEEATHEVHIRDSDAVHYDEQTHRLRVTFTFPVCHAGLYRVHRLRLCNGGTWLAYYPQRNVGGSCGASGWAPSLRAEGSHAFSPPRPTHVTVEPLYQLVGRSALLQVPEQRSSVHLRLTLPREAHCFADSVDYVTLDVELEDPLSISAPSADGLGGVMSATFTDPQRVKGLAAGPGKHGRVAGEDGRCPTADCTCSFRVSPGNLLLPLSAGRSGLGSDQLAHPQRAEPYAPLVVDGAEAHHDDASLRRGSTSSLTQRLLLHPPEDDGANSDGSEVHTPSDTPRLVAAVVLGTPNAYRQKSGAVGAGVARSSLGTSIPSLSMAVSSAGPSRATAPSGGSGVLGLSDSFAVRTSQLVDALSLSRRRVSPRPAAAAHVDVAAAVVPATEAAVIYPGVTHSDKKSPLQQQRQQPSLHAHRYANELHTSSERGAQDGRFTAGGDGVSGDDRRSRGVAASTSGLGSPGIPGGAATTPAPSLLRMVSEDTLELVLMHADTAIRDDRSAAVTPHSAKTAATMSAARTVVPIHLGCFLKDLPSPEVHLTPTKSDVVASGISVLRAECYLAADPLRETVIRLLPSTPHAVAPVTDATGSEKAGVAARHMRLRLPLLPLLTTPISAEALASQRPETVVSGRGAGKDPTPPAAVAANQARIAFTCLRGREPCTTTLSAVLPFQAAIGFNYAFKHLQGRVYCLVKMKNLLTSTSLWLRGAVLHVLDAEPSYELVRVCEVYNTLLLREWKPQEELSILYELDLIPSFHPAQPECTHQVQMEAVYSSWHETFRTTPPEDRLVLRVTELPSTEVTVENVEATHNNVLPGAAGARTSDGAVTQQGAVTTRTTMLPGKAVGMATSTGVTASTLDTATTSCYHSDAGPAAAAQAVQRASLARSTSIDGSGSRSFVHVTHTYCSASSSTTGDKSSNECNGTGGKSSSGVKSQRTASSAVHFNVVTLRHLEETCNTMWGPVAAFRSKHLCVFSIVMYAESPWTMRFGAATNYASQTPHPRATSNISSTCQGSQLSHWSGGKPSAALSLFGNAMVDQPSEFVFVAGEPVRFCVRLQPQAQNWPEDAEMEETFFIRLKYNPEQWMVIGKQRDRRTLSLMEEATVYFNAVPLLPLTSADGDRSAAGSPTAAGAATSIGGSSGKGPPRGADDSANGSDEDTDEDKDVDAATRTGRRQRRSTRPLAGHAVKDEGILQTPTVEMFWERKKPTTATDGAANLSMNSFGAGKRNSSAAGAEAGPSVVDGQSTGADTVMGEAVLVDVVQFRTWVRVRKRGH